MTMDTLRLGMFVLVGGMFLGGCASKPPTIAHTHIGHAITGWHDTPGQQGLLLTAESAAQTALRAADSAVGKGNDLAGMKTDVTLVMKATNPGSDAEGTGNAVKQYGVRNALSGAEHHIVFSAESPDASENIITSSEIFSWHAQVVLDRCDLVVALGDEILGSSSPEEAGLLAEELRKLTYANLNGEDTNGDGIAGSIREEFGLKQLRKELQAMIDREDPPYSTVDSWYLFNLVRLPSGEWIFRRFSSGGAASSGTSY